ncbi:hypothetical protein Tco_0347422 [Tanacetum coccineum]
MAERPNLDEDKGGKLIDPTRFRGCHDTRRSILVQLISGHRLLAGHSKKQKSNAISTTEADINRPFRMLCSILWMRSHSGTYGIWFYNIIPMY